MELKQLSPDLMVSRQLEPDDIPQLAKHGVRAIIVNRPDNEGPDQPRWQELAFIARGCGLEVRYVPVIPGQLGEEEVEAFGSALSELPAPVAAFCKTGTRSTMLWALSNPDGLSADERIRIAAEQDYDISGLRPRLSGGS